MQARWVVLTLAVLVGLGLWWLVAGTPTDPPRSSNAALTGSSHSASAGDLAASHAPPRLKTDLNPRATASLAPEFTTPPASPELYWKELEELERTDQKRALDYAFAGEEWYPEQGKAAEARRAKIVTLLVALGRMPEARERTRRFIELYPNSPYRRLVQGVTGIHPRPGAPPRR